MPYRYCASMYTHAAYCWVTCSQLSLTSHCLNQIVFSPFDKEGGSGAGSGLPPDKDAEETRLFLVIYQHGNSIWAGPPASAVRCPAAPAPLFAAG